MKNIIVIEFLYNNIKIKKRYVFVENLWKTADVEKITIFEIHCIHFEQHIALDDTGVII